jgi:hypothetical protein
MVRLVLGALGIIGFSTNFIRRPGVRQDNGKIVRIPGFDPGVRIFNEAEIFRMRRT